MVRDTRWITHEQWNEMVNMNIIQGLPFTILLFTGMRYSLAAY